jgi:hypothetical protein
MKGDINFNFKINKKIALISVLSMGFYAFADYVSLIDTKSSGGIIVTSGVTEDEMNAAIDKAISELRTEHEADIANLELEKLPVGTVAMWTTSNIPTGWIEMNGQSTSSYPELAVIVGANVPDVRGRFPRAWDNGKGIDLNRGLMTNQAQDFKGIYLRTHQNVNYSYTHDQQYFKHVGSASVGHLGLPNFGGGWSNPSSGIHLGFGNEEIRPTNFSIVYIIKAL